jgi:hypothetical protein
MTSDIARSSSASTHHRWATLVMRCRSAQSRMGSFSSFPCGSAPRERAHQSRRRLDATPWRKVGLILAGAEARYA